MGGRGEAVNAMIQFLFNIRLLVGTHLYYFTLVGLYIDLVALEETLLTNSCFDFDSAP